jgi:hypothetical protein
MFLRFRCENFKITEFEKKKKSETVVVWLEAMRIIVIILAEILTGMEVRSFYRLTHLFSVFCWTRMFEMHVKYVPCIVKVPCSNLVHEMSYLDGYASNIFQRATARTFQLITDC